MNRHEAQAYLIRVLTKWDEFTKCHGKFVSAIEETLCYIQELEMENERLKKKSHYPKG